MLNWSAWYKPFLVKNYAEEYNASKILNNCQNSSNGDLSYTKNMAIYGWLPNRTEIQIKIGFKMAIQYITSINFLFSLSFSLSFTCESTDVCLKGNKSMIT